MYLSTEIRKNRGKKKEDDCFVVSIKTLFCFLFVLDFFKRKWDKKLKTSKHAVCLCCQTEEIEISPRLWESGITLSAEDCGATDHCTSSSCEICFLIASCFCCFFFFKPGFVPPPCLFYFYFFWYIPLFCPSAHLVTFFNC